MKQCGEAGDFTVGLRPATFLAALIAFGGCVGPGAAARGHGESRPNVVLVMCDDLGWGDVGFNGGKHIPTPHLDAMAAGSLRFERFYASSPVCSPTRGSVVTGRYPTRYGIAGANSGHLPAGEFTIYEALAANGYATGHFGKWHLGTLTKTVKESNRGGPRGAAHYSPPWEHAVEVTFATEAKTPTYDPMIKPRGAGNRWWPRLAADSESVPYGTHYWAGPDAMVDPHSAELRGDDSAIIMARALGFVGDAVAAERPFLAVIWLHAPHLPVVAPAATDYATSYRGAVMALDAEMGRLRARLRELGVAENTIVAFCSDNGPEGRKGKAPGSAGPLRGRKRDLLEGGIRVPGLLEWPARIRGARSTNVPCGTVDYLPTILAATGSAGPGDDRPFDGVDLMPLIDGDMQARPRRLAFEFKRQRALIGDRFKLYSRDAGESFQLFDLVTDPGETEDVGNRHPAVRVAMRAELAAWRASCAASAERQR
ncbi:MAG: sulfatase-like hydrolase/transferase [bacterium]|nr:sulfatase-like hydrolase/transferase [bacterium]